MKAIYKVMILGFLGTFLAGCASTGLKAINGLAKLGDYKAVLNVSYGENSLHKLDIYLPEKHVIKASIVFFYGGCWGQCSKHVKKDYLFVAETLVKQGYAVVIPDYAKYPEVHFDGVIDDAKKATLWFLKNHQKHGIESDNIFLMGHSSGAHMAALLADDESLLKTNLSQITGFIGLAGPYDFYPFNGKYMYQLFSSENDYYNSQPINFINGGEPPHLLLQGMNDDKVFPHNAINMAEKLKLMHVEHKLVLFDKMSHVNIIAGLAKPFRRHSRVLKNIVEFIDSQKN